jgi:hypothetical protein
MRLFLSAIVLSLLVLSVGAQQFSQVVDETTIIGITGRTDADTEELAVGPSGNIYVIDEDESGNDRVLRFNSAGGGGVIITTEDDIVAAIELVNGANSTVTDFSINGIELDSDGDVILTNGDGSGPDSLVSVVDAASGAITVVSTEVSPTVSAIEGCTGMTVIGTTAFCGVNGAFGAAEDSVITIDVNAAGPTAAGTTIITEAELIAANGAAAGAYNLNAFSAGASGLIFADSGGAGTTDDVFTSDTAGTTVSVLILATTIETALGVADIGINDTAWDGNGDLWLSNPFGGSGDAADDGCIKIGDPTGTVAIYAFSEADVSGDLGATSSSLEGAGYDSTNSRIVFANGSANNASEGVVTIGQSQVPVELSVFSTD